MTLWQKTFCSAVLLLGMSAAKLYAQVASPSCFAVHVRVNGKLVDGPKMLTFKTKQMEKSVSVEAGCFTVPTAVLNDEKSVDVLFTVPHNKVHLSAIQTGFLMGSWDIELEDKHFGRGVVLPKHARVRQACAVVFHVGEPETASTQTGCRTAF